ncbi:hypothetical protein J4573_19005 [Actinomadura barringtoniae]|uniref:Uncharacterized protein n=1 Tax=Actinomadura barringtoniae TaxID=1427535 RepID=A0A939PAS6_9ACTN|nr:hypothetical protein [Actinomadura barringtoniae]MBO2449201.1 hypothetical protein [Actinomadura barringtoniae]
MKNLLWVVLAGCLAVNAFVSTTSGGATQLVISIITGVGVILSGVGLWMLRTRRS